MYANTFFYFVSVFAFCAFAIITVSQTVGLFRTTLPVFFNIALFAFQAITDHIIQITSISIYRTLWLYATAINTLVS